MFSVECGMSSILCQMYLSFEQSTNYALLHTLFWKLPALHTTGWRRKIGCFIFAFHFPQESSIMSGSFAKNHLQLIRHPMGLRHPTVTNVSTFQKIAHCALLHTFLWKDSHTKHYYTLSFENFTHYALVSGVECRMHPSFEKFTHIYVVINIYVTHVYVVINIYVTHKYVVIIYMSRIYM